MNRKCLAYRHKWEVILEVYGELCAYCHDQPAICIDHVIPISYIDCNRIENLRPACSWCNLLVGSKVFETFEDKYEWLREERQAKRRHRNHRTICTVCWLPYQRPLHSPNLFLCAECYGREYGKPLTNRKQWRDWVVLLRSAEINVDCHREFGEFCWHNQGTTLSMREKRKIFGTIFASYIDEVESA